MLKEKQTLIINNSFELGEDISVESKGKGRYFLSRFIEPGLAHYQELGDILITKETLDKFIHTIVGCPIIIKHKDISDSNVDKERVGVISDVWYDQMDGWYYCNGIIWDKEAIDLIKNQNWSVSCTYDFESDFKKGTYHGKEYNMEFTNGEFLHLALVNNPRYERANIVVNSKDEVENKNDNHEPAGSPKGGQFAKKETSETNRNINAYVKKLYPAVQTKKINENKYIVKLPMGNEYQTEFDNFMNKKFNLYAEDTKFENGYIETSYITKKDETSEKNEPQDVPEDTFTDDYNKIYKEFSKINQEWLEQFQSQENKKEKQIIAVKDNKFKIMPLSEAISYKLDDFILSADSFKEKYYKNDEKIINNEKKENEGDSTMTVLNDLEEFIKNIVKNSCDKEEDVEDKKEVENEEEKEEQKESKEDKKEDSKEEEEKDINKDSKEEIENKCKNSADDEEKEEKFEEEKKIADKVENADDEEKAINSMEDVKKAVFGGDTKVENTTYIPHSKRIEMGNNY